MADAPDSSSADAHPATPTTHQVAGHFRLVREIGSGSSGTVYEARLTQDWGELPAGTQVAVKFLRPELAADEKARARLFAEGELGRQLRHENVAAIHGVETISLLGLETTYLVMQFVQGTTLRDLLQRSGSPVEDLTRRLGVHAARGLSALHRRGLVHRDVKPENLILTPASELKIVDLGLARPFGTPGGGSSPSQSSGHSSGRSPGLGLAGSVAYTAPEILRGERAGPRSDLYALGVVLYEVTTGLHPFHQATTADEMLHAHLYDAPPPPSHLRPRVSPFLEQLLLDLLQKDPEARPRSAAEVARILEQGERSDWWRKHEARAPVLASSRRLGRMRRPAEAAFVGRRRERQALDEALEAARAGRGRVLAVTGPVGIGRRRLMDEAMQRWLDEPEPPRYLGGDADGGLGHGEPFASTMLDFLLRGDGRHSPNARPRAVDRARERIGLQAGEAEALVAVAFGDSTEPSDVRADRLATALLRLPAPGQVLVVRVDHADELDTSGLLVLQRLAEAASTRHLLVLLAAGPDTKLVGPDQRLEVPGLDEDEFLAFGRSLFRAPAEDPRIDEFVQQAHQVLSGLPGNLLELLDHLSQTGELRGRVGDYHGLAGDAEPRPAPGHLERFRSRVATLDPTHRAVLSAAAILGDRCALAELAALVGDAEISVLETLSLFRGRIVRAQAGEVSFRHRDFRQALLRALPNDEQQALHRRAAGLLAARGARPLVVGMHLSQALEHEAALDPLLEGLQNRVRAGSRRTSLRLLGRIAVHLRHVEDSEANRRRRLRYLVLAGQAHQLSDQDEPAVRAFREAERLARDLGDLEMSAAARIGLADSERNLGRLLSAIALLESVHDDLVEAEDGARDRRATLAAEAHALHGRILLYLGQAADSLKHLQAAKKRTPPDGDDDLRCQLWIDLARAEALSYRIATALRTLRDIEKADAVRNLPRARLRFHLHRGQVRMLAGDPEAGQDLRFAIDEAARLVQPVYGARAALFLGERAFWRHRDDEARARFEEAMALARAGSDRLGEALARAWLLRLGAHDAELADVVEELDLPILRATWLLALAGAGEAPADAGPRLEQLLETADLPLPLHLRALHHLDRPASARSLVRAIGQRFPERSQRLRFRSEWERPARV